MRIQYVPDRMPLSYIRTAINNAGFDADSTKAEPDSYKMLPRFANEPKKAAVLKRQTL